MNVLGGENMYRHISLFTLEDKNEIPKMKAMLEEIGKNDDTIKMSVVKQNVSYDAPIFADLVQMLHFDNLNDLNAYPKSQGHQNLMKNGPKCKVKAIDYEI